MSLKIITATQPEGKRNWECKFPPVDGTALKNPVSRADFNQLIRELTYAYHLYSRQILVMGRQARAEQDTVTNIVSTMSTADIAEVSIPVAIVVRTKVSAASE